MFPYLKIIFKINSIVATKVIYIFFVCIICWSMFVRSDTNIALHKPAFQSSVLYGCEATNAVDGNFTQHYKSCAHGDASLNALNWFAVDLMDIYYVSLVILTPRDSPDTDVSKRMDYVYIGISNTNVSGKVEYPVYPLCRQSPYTADTSKNMSISCRPNTPPGRYVVVQQPTTQYGFLAICEIQVFGIKMNISSSDNETCQGNYYGDKCDKYCNCDKGVKCDQQGICPNGCDANWKGDHCDIKKYDGSQLVGCFEYNQSSLYELPQMNSSSCISTCSGYGFTYAAKKTADICICTDAMNWTSLVKNELCQNDCTTETCQKFFYSVCPHGTYGYDCTLQCNCLNNGRCSYMEGSCEDGCANGWTSDSCDVRDCTTGNGGCDQNEICVSKSSDVTSCQCLEGYNRSSAWLPCQKINTENVIHESTKPAIIGGVIGSIAGLCLITAMAIIIVKCIKRPQETNTTAENYYESESVKNTSNQTLYETPAITYVQDENKYKSLKPTECSRKKMEKVVF